MFLLEKFLHEFVRVGRLTVVDASGKRHVFGGAGGEPENITVALEKRSLTWKLVLHPELYLGEAYMDGSLELVEGSVYDLLAFCGRNLAEQPRRRRGLPARAAIRLGQRLTQWNTRRRASRNVVHHYDLSRALYESFLDADMQYSCAYFRIPQASLDDAQAAKRTHLAAKLLLHRNQRVLDIGSGWGGLAIDLAKRAQVRVDGVTLSREQLLLACGRAAEAGVGEDVRFHLKDYRALEGRYDRIVSVGMFEHVGVPFYPAFFEKIRDLLVSDGVAVVHSIGATDGPGIGSAWIRKYIFPGGYIPALSEVLPAVEASGLFVTDIEILRLHYAETLRHWRQRFLANWATIAHLYDARFKRMWEFYLASSEMGFRFGGLMVFQLQLAKDRSAVPLTRDYIHDYEHAAPARAFQPLSAIA
jgi:cyclopropane-fatty-acyl-phospholipid synthase